MIKQDENQITPETEAPKAGLMQSAKDFMTGVFSPLKGKDMGQLIEDFTSEMTLVAEGLSEDQQKLFDGQQRLSAQQTELEARLHSAEDENRELQKELTALKARLEKTEKQLQERKASKTGGLASILRQATWLTAIFCGAWVVVTIIRALTYH
jgi:septal ring factor EnvC (AmiA/AmiB activator)